MFSSAIPDDVYVTVLTGDRTEGGEVGGQTVMVSERRGAGLWVPIFSIIFYYDGQLGIQALFHVTGLQALTPQVLGGTVATKARRCKLSFLPKISTEDICKL